MAFRGALCQSLRANESFNRLVVLNVKQGINPPF